MKGKIAISRSSLHGKNGLSSVRAVALVAALGLAILSLADRGSAGDKKVVGTTVLSLQSPYVIALDDAMKVQAASEGIDLVFLDSARSVTKELDQVENLITRKVNLIVMIPVDQKTSQSAAKLVNQAGIPLVLLTAKFTDDFTVNGGKFVTYVGSDDNLAGEIQGQYLADKLPEGGNVIYLVLDYGLSATAHRKAGFESVMNDHPKLRIVAELQGRSSRVNGQAVMESLLQKFGNGQLQALVAQNDEMAIGASSAIEAAGRLGEFKVIIGINGLKPGLEAIATGTLTATVFQNAAEQGKQAMIAAGKILAGQTVEPEILIPFKLVTKENVSSIP
jgi:inositol transport system substrate-binding protein